MEFKWRHHIIGGTVLQLDILCQQVKLPIPGMSSLLLSHWPKGYHRPHPQTSQALVKAIGYTLQPDGKAPLLKTQLMSLIMEKLSWCQIRNFTPTN